MNALTKQPIKAYIYLSIRELQAMVRKAESEGFSGHCFDLLVHTDKPEIASNGAFQAGLAPGTTKPSEQITT